jgi:hypothetical protein
MPRNHLAFHCSENNVCKVLVEEMELGFDETSSDLDRRVALFIFGKQQSTLRLGCVL